MLCFLLWERLLVFIWLVHLNICRNGRFIGSGIFITPSGVLAEINSVYMSLFIWILCGLVSILGKRNSNFTYLYLMKIYFRRVLLCGASLPCTKVRVWLCLFIRSFLSTASSRKYTCISQLLHKHFYYNARFYCSFSVDQRRIFFIGSFREMFSWFNRHQIHSCISYM